MIVCRPGLSQKTWQTPRGPIPLLNRLHVTVYFLPPTAPPANSYRRGKRARDAAVRNPQPSTARASSSCERSLPILPAIEPNHNMRRDCSQCPSRNARDEKNKNHPHRFLAWLQARANKHQAANENHRNDRARKANPPARPVMKRMREAAQNTREIGSAHAWQQEQKRHFKQFSIHRIQANAAVQWRRANGAWHANRPLSRRPMQADGWKAMS